MTVTWRAAPQPDDPDHMDAAEAVGLYNRATRKDKDTSPDTFRKWLRDAAAGDGDEPVRGFVFGMWGKWWVSRESMLDVFEAQAQHLLRVVEDAREAARVRRGK